MSFHNNKLKKLIIAAMFGAIICVVTMVVKYLFLWVDMFI